jgi:hypothetical protein
MEDDYIDFQAGSLLTAGELNTFDTWQLYIDQELDDGKSAIDGTVEGEAVKEVTGTVPILVDNTNNQTPVVSIDQTYVLDNPNDLVSDTKVMSEKAIDSAFSQIIGPDPGYPAQGYAGKIGKLRIDPSGAIPNTFFWSGSAWVQIQTKGEQGDQGPPGPAPGLQDPAATAVNVPLQGDGSLGTATADVLQDPATKDLKFLFGIPVGQKGDKGEDSTVPGPPPGLQDPAALAYAIGVKPDGTVGEPEAEVIQDSNGDLQFAFGIPTGQTGAKGEKGDQGDTGQAVSYKGPIDATTAAEPTDPANGDFYVNTVDGTSSWTGLSDVIDGTRIIWNGTTNKWDAYDPTYAANLGYTAAADKGTITNTNGSDAELPLVTLSNAGLMSPADKGKLNNVEAGAQVNPDLSTYLQSGDNVSELTNDAGYITSADVPASPVTSVNSLTGDVELGLQEVLDQGNTSTTDLWVGDAGETVKLLNTGTVEASGSVEAPSVVATGGGFSGTGLQVSGSVSAGSYRIDLLPALP